MTESCAVKCDWLLERAILPARDFPPCPARTTSSKTIVTIGNKSFIDQVWGQDVCILALFFFASLWISPSSRPRNTQTKNLANIQLSLASQLVNYPYMSVSDVSEGCAYKQGLTMKLSINEQNNEHNRSTTELVGLQTFGWES